MGISRREGGHGLEAESLRQHVRGTSRRSPPALPQDAQLLVGQKEEAPALTAPGSRGGSWKGRGQSRFPFPHSLPDVSY